MGQVKDVRCMVLYTVCVRTIGAACMSHTLVILCILRSLLSCLL